MWLALILFLGITGAVRLANSFLPFNVCPVCAGVSGTWFLLTALGLAGYVDAGTYQPFTLLLMGGTVAGIAYQGEKSLAWPGRQPLLWKTMVIAIGMPIAFLAASRPSPAILAIEAAVLAGLIYLFFIRSASDSYGDGGLPAPTKIQELEKKLKDCC